MDSVTISKAEYEQLLDSDLMLRCLENAGVDNWDGYDFAMDEYHDLKGDDL